MHPYIYDIHFDKLAMSCICATFFLKVSANRISYTSSNWPLAVKILTKREHGQKL